MAVVLGIFITCGTPRLYFIAFNALLILRILWMVAVESPHVFPGPPEHLGVPCGPLFHCNTQQLSYNLRISYSHPQPFHCNG